MQRVPFETLMQDLALSPQLLESLATAPWKHSFLALMRRIGANSRIDPVGTAQLPQAEPFRLGQLPHLTFAPSEIARVAVDHKRLVNVGRNFPRRGCGYILGLSYAAIPRLCRYSTGLREPSETLIRFALYQRMYESTISMN